jgi:RND family efflux transporter MFP subunit
MRTNLLIGGLLCLFSLATLAEDGSTLDGVIEPFMTVELSSRIDGIIEVVSVDVGDSIEKNQVVARLESAVELAALEYARAKASIDSDVRQQETSLAYGQRQLSRIKELHEKKLSSFQDYDKVETETRLIRYKLVQAKENKHLAALDLKQVEAIYNRHTIRSPIDGIVVDRYLNPGESVEEHPIVKIAQINPLRVVVVAPVSMLGKIKTGQLAMVSPEIPVGGIRQAVVKIVDPILDAASGTFRVRLEIPNEDFSLTSGLRCQVRFLDKMAPQKAEPSTSRRQDTLAQGASVMEQNGPADSQAAKSEQRLPIATPNSRKEMQGPDYMIVTHEPLLPLSKATQQAKALHEKGVTDTWIITKGGLKGHISLGIFSNRKWAENYRQQLSDLGIETSIVKR